YNILQNIYWFPKYQDIRMKACSKPPMKEVLIQKLSDVCTMENYNIAWIDEKHRPDKKWLIDVLGTLKPDDEIFKKNYVAPPISKKLKDIETIVMPSQIFEDMPSSKSKAKARRLKVVSEAFAQEKASRLKQVTHDLDKHILD
ncbi:MAG: hypothetical protein ACK56F_06255, partial [bacterium]